MPTDSSDDTLEPGLRAAFGPAPHATRTQGPVLATLGAARVLLRDDPEEPAPLVRPLARHADAGRAGGRYQVLGEIARGGVGRVLKGRDVDLGRDVAMKVLLDDHARNPHMLQRFVEEAQIAGQLQHPGILPVYELGLHADRTPFFTMKLVRGQTLAALLAQGDGAARVPGEPAGGRARLLQVFEQVCQTVAYAHAKGVIHRDLKPSNVMVGHFGEVQIVDWGLAKVLARGGVADEPEAHADAAIATVRTAAGSRSLAGSVMGTPAYMPPEQARGEVARVSERSDVFALGAILCELLTGTPPYRSDAGPLLDQARRAALEPALARLAAADAGEALTGLARRCLAPEPAERPRDAGVVAAAIESYHRSLAERARASELAAAAARARAGEERRARRLTLALAAVVLVSLGLLAGAWYWQDALRRQAAEAERARASAALEQASEALGRAVAAPLGESGPWERLDAATAQLDALLAGLAPGSDGAARGAALRKRVAEARRDNAMALRVEELVALGATHDDRESWQWMERELRRAFLDYGIDLEQLAAEEIAARIRASELAPQLTDGYELWFATIGDLQGRWGVDLYDRARMNAWLQALYLADPDPVALRIRRNIYERPDRAEIMELYRTVDFEHTRPRTLSWLASTLYIVGEYEHAQDVLRRALLQHPDDFMLNFDYTYHCTARRQWDEAIRVYYRCLGLRPESAGIWRSLGVAWLAVDEPARAVDALEQAIRYQPAHAPIWYDLGRARAQAGAPGAALAAFLETLRRDPDDAAARRAALTSAWAASRVSGP